MRINQYRAGLGSALFLSLVNLPLAGQEPARGARQMTLIEALELAEQKSEAVGIAKADVARAQGERRRARSSYFPQLSGSASYTRTLRSQFSALEGRRLQRQFRSGARLPQLRSPARASG